MRYREFHQGMVLVGDRPGSGYGKIAPHHRPIGQSLPPRGSLGTRQIIFASLCASTMRQGEALEQDIKKNKSSCGKMPQDDFAVLLYAV